MNVIERNILQPKSQGRFWSNLLSLFMCCIVITACQSSTETAEETPPMPPVEEASIPKLTPEQQAANKTKALLEKYPNQDGYIKLTWDTLANMDFDIRFVEELEGEVPFPIFSETVKELAGELVTIEGFVIPFEETGDEEVIFLSAFPYTQCFFCGAAGPESVMDILATEPLGRLKLDDKLRFRGRLRLNDDDLDYLNYILDDAELMD